MRSAYIAIIIIVLLILAAMDTSGGSRHQKIPGIELLDHVVVIKAAFLSFPEKRLI